MNNKLLSCLIAGALGFPDLQQRVRKIFTNRRAAWSQRGGPFLSGGFRVRVTGIQAPGEIAVSPIDATVWVCDQDGLLLHYGLDGQRAVPRAALAAGPKALFVAYDRAQRKSRDLVPLSDVIRKRLGEAPK